MNKSRRAEAHESDTYPVTDAVLGEIENWKPVYDLDDIVMLAASCSVPTTRALLESAAAVRNHSDITLYPSRALIDEFGGAFAHDFARQATRNLTVVFSRLVTSTIRWRAETPDDLEFYSPLKDVCDENVAGWLLDAPDFIVHAYFDALVALCSSSPFVAPGALDVIMERASRELFERDGVPQSHSRLVMVGALRMAGRAVVLKQHLSLTAWNNLIEPADVPRATKRVFLSLSGARHDFLRRVPASSVVIKTAMSEMEDVIIRNFPHPHLLMRLNIHI